LFFFETAFSLGAKTETLIRQGDRLGFWSRELIYGKDIARGRGGRGRRGKRRGRRGGRFKAEERFTKGERIAPACNLGVTLPVSPTYPYREEGSDRPVAFSDDYHISAIKARIATETLLNLPFS
jgi:hypothetical protein